MSKKLTPIELRRAQGLRRLRPTAPAARIGALYPARSRHSGGCGRDHFRHKRLDSFRAAVWVKTEHEPIYAQEHLDQMRQFTSVLTLTFRVMR